MSLRDRIAAAYDAITAPAEPLGLGLQALAANESTLANPQPWLSSLVGGGRTAAGKLVTPESSMRVAAVYACVRVLSESVSQLPLLLYRRTEKGTEPATDHPLYTLLRDQVNPEVTAQDARAMSMNHLCLRGNSYFQIVRSGGRVVELNPLHPDWVRMYRNAAGELTYDYDAPGGSRFTFSSREVWRIIGMSFNGIQGVSPLTYAREAIGLAMATEEHGATLFRNGAQIGLQLTAPDHLTQEQIAQLKESLEMYRGSSNAHKTLILENAMTAQSLAMTSVDSQFLESRRFQIEDICRFFNVPPHKVQELARATFNNIEHLTMDFKNSSLAPFMVRFEQSGNRDLLLPGERGTYFLRHDTSQLDRGDSAALVNLIASGIANTWLSPDEGRALMGYNPRPDGKGGKYENPNTSSGATKPNQPVPDPAKG